MATRFDETREQIKTIFKKSDDSEKKSKKKPQGHARPLGVKLEDSFKNTGNRTSTDVGPVFQVPALGIQR